MNVVSYYLAMLKGEEVVSRDKLLLNLRSAVDGYREFTADYIESAKRIVDNSEKGNEPNKMVTTLFKKAGFRVKTPSDAFDILQQLGENCVMGSGLLERKVEAYIPQYSTKEVLTMKQLATIDMVDATINTLNFIDELTIAVVYYVSNGEYDIIKREKHILQAAAEYSETLVAFHKDYRKEIEKLDDLSDIKVDAPTSVYMAQMSNKDKAFINSRSGFNGNVVFHINNIWGDIKIWYYEYLNSRRDWMKAKLQELELKLENGDGDTERLKDVIANYEERLAKYEKRIVDFEETYG